MRLLATFEASFNEFAAAVVAGKPKTTREAHRLLRAAWRAARPSVQSKAVGAEIVAVPALLDDEDDNADRK